MGFWPSQPARHAEIADEGSAPASVPSKRPLSARFSRSVSRLASRLGFSRSVFSCVTLCKETEWMRGSASWSMVSLRLSQITLAPLRNSSLHLPLSQKSMPDLHLCTLPHVCTIDIPCAFLPCLCACSLFAGVAPLPLLCRPDVQARFSLSPSLSLSGAPWLLLLVLLSIARNADLCTCVHSLFVEHL
jgi:hypothetical protein